MRSLHLLVAALVALPALVALAPAASAIPCYQDEENPAPCCPGASVAGQCIMTPCGDKFLPPCPQAKPADATRHCEWLVRGPDNYSSVCWDAANPDCLVRYFRATKEEYTVTCVGLP